MDNTTEIAKMPTNLPQPILETSDVPKKGGGEFFYQYSKTFLNDYVGAGLYGMVENCRALGFIPPPGNVDISTGSGGGIARATEGLQKIFDQNMGDGTIAALGFIGADSLLLIADNVSKKLGKKGFDPKIRFLTSLAFGVGLASYLESTKFLGNTIDFQWGGDLFGVALGAAAILIWKVAADRLKGITNEKVAEKIEGLKKKCKSLTVTLSQSSKLNKFSNKLATKPDKPKDTAGQDVEKLAREYVQIIDVSPEPPR